MTFRKRHPAAGSSPGTLAIPEDSPPPRIRVFDYGPDACGESAIDDPEELRPYIASSGHTWVDVQGFGDEDKLREIGEILGLHPLTLEDATNVPQRAKSDVFESHQRIIARAPLFDEDGRMQVPQVCMILGKDFVVTFQDRYFGFFDGVRTRLREGVGRPIRRFGADYLAYALLDALVDQYFPIVERMAIALEDLEEEVSSDPDPELLARVHSIRRDLVVVRRVGWPMREALREILRDDSPFIRKETLRYLQQVDAHVTQIMEAVDSSREMATGLVDVYLSGVGQKANEVMMVLTLMASIFIPLTFIAGIYGMNFENMPELHDPYGYPIAIGAMLAVAVGMIVFFRRKRWIGSQRRRR